MIKQYIYLKNDYLLAQHVWNFVERVLKDISCHPQVRLFLLAQNK